MTKTISALMLGTCALCLTATAGPAFAQGDGYQPRAITLGAFRAFPTLHAGVGYDDNIYRDDNNLVDDMFYNVGGGLTVESNWSVHMLNLVGGFETLWYNDFEDENRTAWNAGSNARLDVMRGTDINLSAMYRQQFEARNNPNTGVSPVEPLEYDVTHFAGSIRHKPTVLGVEVGGFYDIYDYSNARLSGGGFLSNRDRDHDEYGVYGRVTYDASPGYAVYGRVGYNEHEFDLPFDRSGANRDSSGYTIDAGLDLEVTRLLQGHLFVGYYTQDYIAPLDDVDGFRFGAALDWFPTNLMTVHLAASHALVDTTLIGASTSAQSQVGVSVDYELLRQLVLNAGVNYLWADFEGAARSDGYLDAFVGGRYFMNRYIALGANYRYGQRESDVPGQDYDVSVVSANISLQM